jgi:phthiodiolone/phenolphthiodiolone dimycocerosates ketoreductase
MPDVITHNLDPDVLREIAPKIPSELVEDARFHGNVDELMGQFQALADAGLEYVVLCNLTGSIGGAERAERFAPEFAELVKRLRDL